MRTEADISLALLIGGGLASASVPGSDASRETPFSPCPDMPVEQIDHVDFNAYFPTERQAVDLAAQIDETLFDVVVRTSADKPDWILRAIYRELPDEETHVAQVERLPMLAKQHGGRYAGFGCSSKRHRR